MTLNFPGPYEIRTIYTTSNLTGGVLTHVMKQNIRLVEPVTQGQDFSTIQIQDRNGPAAAIFLNSAVEIWLTVLAPLFNNAFSFDAVELWKYPVAQSFDSEFWSVYGPPTAQPSSVSSAHEAGQAIWTFRTSEGGVMKLSLMETKIASGTPRGYDNMSAEEKAVVDHVLTGSAGYDAPFLGRDTSYPFASVKLYPGRNEALFKRRFR